MPTHSDCCTICGMPFDGDRKWVPAAKEQRRIVSSWSNLRTIPGYARHAWDCAPMENAINSLSCMDRLMARHPDWIDDEMRADRAALVAIVEAAYSAHPHVRKPL